MAEAQPQASASQPAAPAAPAAEPQLSPTEAVYKEFGIEDTAASFQPETPQAPAPQATPAPQTPPAKFDPFDPNFGNLLAQQQAGVASINQALQATRAELGTLRQALNSERTEADIKRAVSSIAEKSGLDPKFAEVAFQLRAKEDARLLQIWNNRGNNPKALEKAIDAVATEFKSQYSVKQDPQLVENQRAARTSQQQMATTTKQTDQDKWAEMSPVDRQREVQRLLRAGGR